MIYATVREATPPREARPVSKEALKYWDRGQRAPDPKKVQRERAAAKRNWF